MDKSKVAVFMAHGVCAHTMAYSGNASGQHPK